MEVKTLSAKMFVAVQAAVKGASEVGEGLIEPEGSDPFHSALVTLARIRHIEHGIQVAVAQMLKIPLEQVTRLSDDLSLMLVMSKAASGIVAFDEALTLTRGRGAPEVEEAVARRGLGGGPRDVADALSRLAGSALPGEAPALGAIREVLSGKAGLGLPTK